MSTTVRPSDPPATERLRAGKEMTVVVASGGSALVERFEDGVAAALDTTALASGQTYTFGEYGIDVVLRISCLTGSLSYAEGQDTGTLLDSLLEGSGAVPVGVGTLASISGLTVQEYGDSAMRRTVFTMAAMPVTFTDDAGVAQWSATKLYDFPAGNILTIGASIDADLTLNETWWVDNTPGDVGLGTAATTDGTTLATTDQDIIPTTSIAALTSQVGPINAQSVDVNVTGAAGGTDADVVLNMLIDDNVAHMPDVVTNGAFTTDTGWTKGTGWTVDSANSNTAGSDGSQSADSDLEQVAAGLVPGVTYKCVFDVTRSAGTVRLVIGGTLGTARSTANTFTENIVAGSDGSIKVRADADFVGTVDNLVVTPLTGTGTVTGTITVLWAQAGDY